MHFFSIFMQISLDLCTQLCILVVDEDERRTQPTTEETTMTERISKLREYLAKVEKVSTWEEADVIIKEAVKLDNASYFDNAEHEEAKAIYAKIYEIENTL